MDRNLIYISWCHLFYLVGNDKYLRSCYTYQQCLISSSFLASLDPSHELRNNVEYYIDTRLDDRETCIGLPYDQSAFPMI